MKVKTVKVWWVDAYTVDGWHDRYMTDYTSSHVVCFTQGVLLKKTKKFLYVSSTVASNEQYGSTWAIPRAWVIKVKTKKTSLKFKKMRRKYGR